MRYVIVGNGIAGLTAARLIARSKHVDAELDVYSDEPYLYYPRPKLPDFMAGNTSTEQLIQYPMSWYEQQGIRVHLERRATQLDVPNKRIYLHDGTEVSYDRLLLANGSHANLPPIKGSDKTGVFTLRTLADAMAIQAWAQKVEHVAVIGGGLLGLETARAIRQLGPQVTVVELLPRLLPMQLDVAGAGVLHKKLHMPGQYEILVGTATEEILGTERPTGVRTKDGREIPAEMVVVSAGVRSNVAMARDAGLEVNRGVVVDQTMRTSAPDIWAAGDVAEFNGRVWGIVPAALAQAGIAGTNMAAPEDAVPTTYTDIVPSTTLKVVGIDLTSMGIVNPEQEGFREISRIDEDTGAYEKLVIHNGKIVGAILLGSRDRVAPIMKLIHDGTDVSPHVDRLLDRDFDLRTILEPNP